MSTPRPDGRHGPYRLRTARVLRVEEQACEVWSSHELSLVRFAPSFPSPRVERVSPGHLVAIAMAPDGDAVVVWRWYDAVVLGREGDGTVRLWEPAHGEVLAKARESYGPQDPGSRAYASSGLPGAQWWVAGSADDALSTVTVDLDEVEAMYAENGLWSTAFEMRP